MLRKGRKWPSPSWRNTRFPGNEKKILSIANKRKLQVIKKRCDKKKCLLVFNSEVFVKKKAIISYKPARAHYNTSTGKYESVTGQTAGYEYSKAKHVAVASSLDNYQLHPAKRVSADKWEVALIAQTDFSYFYIVDHNAVVTPCRIKEKDDFGGNNCVLDFPDP